MRRRRFFFTYSLDGAPPVLAGPFSTADVRFFAARAFLRSWPGAAVSLVHLRGRSLRLTPFPADRFEAWEDSHA